MSTLNELIDSEFVPFLHSLGIETNKKTFEWMLNDCKFAGVLRWLYKNLDHNNALSAREERRYLELEKKGELLSSQDLEASIAHIQEQYKGLCLPGDQEAAEDVKLDISMMQERLALLEKQESVINVLERKNMQIEEELNLEIIHLNSLHDKCVLDEQEAAQECIGLAQDVENITNSVVNVIADSLKLYESCQTDKEIASKFYTFGPLETYRQSIESYKSHFDMYASKNFSEIINDVNLDEEVWSTLTDTHSLEERFIDTIHAYVESKVELIAECAILVSLEVNYNNMDQNQMTPCQAEVQSDLSPLKFEEMILEQQLQAAGSQLAHTCTDLDVEITAQAELVVKEPCQAEVQSDLSPLMFEMILEQQLQAAGSQLAHTCTDLDVEITAQAELVVKEVCQAKVQGDQSQLELENLELEQQLQAAGTELAETYTDFVVGAVAQANLVVREQIHNDLSHLLDTTRQAFLLDQVLYTALRHEIRTVKNCLSFAGDLESYILDEVNLVNSRIDAMNDRCAEHECKENQQTVDQLVQTLHLILDDESGNDPLMLVKLQTHIKQKIKELKSDISERYRKNEDFLKDYKNATKDLRDYVWDGFTKTPNSRFLPVAELMHTLSRNIADVETKVRIVTKQFTDVKGADKQLLRKLWQRFLTDKKRFILALKYGRCKDYK